MGWRFSKVLAAGAAVAALAACSKATDGDELTGAYKQEYARIMKTALSAPEPVMDTPEHAVQAWWSRLDTISAAAMKLCLASATVREATAPTLYSAMASPEVVSRIVESRRYLCQPSPLTRTIDSVTPETETRVVVVASMHLTQPLPPDAFDFQKKQYAAGAKVRYVLTKAEKSWKVADVLRFNEDKSGDEAWQREYAPYKPGYSSTIPSQ